MGQAPFAGLTHSSELGTASVRICGLIYIDRQRGSLLSLIPVYPGSGGLGPSASPESLPWVVALKFVPNMAIVLY